MRFLRSIGAHRFLDGEADGGIEQEDPTARPAAWAFVAALVVAAPLLMWFGNQRWFSTDEWGFLVSYSLRDPAGLFEPQNGHWSTLPVVAFQVLYETVGLHGYWVYQLMSVATHLLAVLVVRLVMRRAGVLPWVATLAAISLLLFGHGQQNIFVAIQISFVGAFVLGTTQVLLADHDGGLDWRDLVGVGAGIAAIMCSAVGVAMIPVVAVAVLLRRGWRVAALHVVPVVGVYGIWYLTKRPRTTVGSTDAGPVEAGINIVRWDASGVAAAFRDLAAFPGLGVVLAAVLVAGLVVAWRGISWDRFRRTQGAPVALAVGAVAFFTLTGFSRWMLAGVDAVGSQSRYQYMGAAFLIPLVAVAADALARTWRAAVPALAALFVVGLVGNVSTFLEPSTYVGPQWDRHRDVVVASARHPLAPEVAGNLRIDPERAFFLEIGWLLEAEREGRLPDPGPVDPEVEAELPVRLGFRQGLFGPDPRACQTVEAIVITPTIGQVYRITSEGSGIGVRSVDAEGRPTSPVVTFASGGGRVFTAELAGQRLEVAALDPGSELTICT